jgi:hypothetical protein
MYELRKFLKSKGTRKVLQGVEMLGFSRKEIAKVGRKLKTVGQRMSKAERAGRPIRATDRKFLTWAKREVNHTYRKIGQERHRFMRKIASK